eukprot:6204525-Pleurochrysis_carterae.AAC.3
MPRSTSSCRRARRGLLSERREISLKRARAAARTRANAYSGSTARSVGRRRRVRANVEFVWRALAEACGEASRRGWCRMGEKTGRSFIDDGTLPTCR